MAGGWGETVLAGDKSSPNPAGLSSVCVFMGTLFLHIGEIDDFSANPYEL
jgi:hypothetical protein